MLLKISIKNWNKYNPRSDVKSSSWYRQQNDFFNDPTFYKATPATRLVLIYILCQASKRMDEGIAKISTEMMSDIILIKLSEIEKSINVLCEMGILTVLDTNEISTRSDTIVYTESPCATNERTDERTNEHAEKISPLASIISDKQILSWISNGQFSIHQELFEIYDHEYLAATIKKAYYWQSENKKRKAGTYLQNWIERDKDAKFLDGLNKQEKSMKNFFIESGCKPTEIK